MRKTFLTSTVAAAAIVGAALLGAVPASAQSFSFGMAPGGIGFSYDSGGYCDQSGCPDDFWDYPVSYCPVFFRGQWYDAPLYYREDRGEYWYWIQDNWRRDQWDGPRPPWACVDRFGPPLGLDFYESHGFGFGPNGAIDGPMTATAITAYGTATPMATIGRVTAEPIGRTNGCSSTATTVAAMGTAMTMAARTTISST